MKIKSWKDGYQLMHAALGFSLLHEKYFPLYIHLPDRRYAGECYSWSR